MNVRRECLKYCAELDEVAQKHPDMDLDLSYFILTYNFLDLNEIDLADAVFDRISHEFFTRTIRDHIIQAGVDTQEMITLRNELESTDIPEIKASIINKLTEVTKNAEVLLIISRFSTEAQKSQYISEQPILDKYIEILSGIELEFNMSSGLPTLN